MILETVLNNIKEVHTYLSGLDKDQLKKIGYSDFSELFLLLKELSNLSTYEMTKHGRQLLNQISRSLDILETYGCDFKIDELLADDPRLKLLELHDEFCHLEKFLTQLIEDTSKLTDQYFNDIDKPSFEVGTTPDESDLTSSLSYPLNYNSLWAKLIEYKKNEVAENIVEARTAMQTQNAMSQTNIRSIFPAPVKNSYFGAVLIPVPRTNVFKK